MLSSPIRAAHPLLLAGLSAVLALAGCSTSASNGSTGVYVLPGGGGDGAGAAVDGGGSSGADGAAATSSSGTSGASGGEADGSGSADGATSGGSSGSGTSGSSGGSGSSSGSLSTKNGYPGNELRIRIVGPSGRRQAVVSGGTTDVAGVVFGEAESITWQHSNGAGGQAFGSPFFQTGKVSLTPGDNIITVTAKRGQETASDTIVVTYNPVFYFPDRLRAEPRVIKTGKATAVHAVVNLGKASSFDQKSLKVYRVDATGNTIATLGQLVDDGNLNSSGDEIKGDGLYSAKFTINDPKAGAVLLRASLTHKIGAQTYGAFTDIATLDVVDNIDSAACNANVQALQAAKQKWQQAGGGAAGRDAAVAFLKSSGQVSQYGLSAAGGNGAWVRFNDGTLGALNLNPAGSRGGEGGDAGPQRYDSPTELPAFGAGLTANRVDSKRALLLNPFDATLPNSEIKSAFDQMQKNACPAYTIESGGVLNNGAATLNHYRAMYQYGVIAMATHGDAYFSDMDQALRTSYGWSARGSEEVVWTGHKISCDTFKATATATCGEKKACSPDQECFLNKAGGSGVCVDHLTADLKRGRVLYGADGVYGITPSFVGRHAQGTFPKSLVYLGACRSLFSGSLAAELFAAGAFSVVGYNGYVADEFARKWGTTFFANIISQKQHSGVAHVTIEDPANKGTFFRLIGAQNLDASYSDIINPSWESGNLNGWLKAGDGRVIPKLGGAVPVGGKFMSIISTGLGYTTQTGEISQKFCIQPGNTKVSFWWKAYSEEFKEYCGSQYQDQFRARLESKAATKTLVDAKVDDLCEVGCKGGSSGNCGKQYKGLTPADVSFDKGGVFMTPWVLAEGDVTPFAGNGSVNLRLFTTDVGDSIYDTAILIDKIDFK